MDTPIARSEHVMSVLVTGATGLLGRTLIRKLLERNDRVVALVRRSRDEPWFRELGATTVLGDLMNLSADALDDRSIKVVYHAAARVDTSGAWRTFVATNIDGTRRLLDSVLPNGLDRFVYISSAGVYGPKQTQRGMCADRVSPRPASYNYYGRSKLAAETVVRSCCDAAGVPWSILRFGFIYGPGHRALSTHVLPLLEMGRYAVLGGGDNRMATLYVDDAADAAILAGTHEAAAGRVYDVAGDEVVTQREFLSAMAEAVGWPAPTKHVPVRTAWVLACLADALSRFPGVRPRITRAVVALMSADHALDTRAIRRELGWSTRTTFAEGMRRANDWYLREQADGGGEEGSVGDTDDQQLAVRPVVG